MSRDTFIPSSSSETHVLYLNTVTGAQWNELCSKVITLLHMDNSSFVLQQQERTEQECQEFFVWKKYSKAVKKHIITFEKGILL